MKRKQADGMDEKSKQNNKKIVVAMKENIVMESNNASSSSSISSSSISADTSANPKFIWTSEFYSISPCMLICLEKNPILADKVFLAKYSQIFFDAFASDPVSKSLELPYDRMAVSNVFWILENKLENINMDSILFHLPEMILFTHAYFQSFHDFIYTKCVKLITDMKLEPMKKCNTLKDLFRVFQCANRVNVAQIREAVCDKIYRNSSSVSKQLEKELSETNPTQAFVLSCIFQQWS